MRLKLTKILPIGVAEPQRRVAAWEQKSTLASALGISLETVYQYLKA